MPLYVQLPLAEVICAPQSNAHWHLFSLPDRSVGVHRANRRTTLFRQASEILSLWKGRTAFI